MRIGVGLLGAAAATTLYAQTGIRTRALNPADLRPLAAFRD